MTKADTQDEISQYVILPRGTDRVVESHSIPSGNFSKALYRAVRNRIDLPVEQGGFGGNDSFGLYDLKGEMGGSTPFLQILVDEFIMPQGRTALLSDLHDERFLSAVKDKHYVDSRALVLRGTNNGYERSIPIFNELAERAGELSIPVMVSGLKVEAFPQDEKGYGLRVVSTGEFTVVKDDRLDPKWNGYRFNTADSKGLPEALDKKNGKRVWFPGEGRLSRLYLDRNLDVSSDNGNLAYSGDSGRVAVVSGEAGAQNLDRIVDAKARNELLSDLDRAIGAISTLSKKLGKN